MVDEYTRASQAWLKPGANLQFLGWLALLGLPALILFLIFFKLDDQGAARSPHPAEVEYHIGH